MNGEKDRFQKAYLMFKEIGFRTLQPALYATRPGEQTLNKKPRHSESLPMKLARDRDSGPMGSKVHRHFSLNHGHFL